MRCVRKLVIPAVLFLAGVLCACESHTGSGESVEDMSAQITVANDEKAVSGTESTEQNASGWPAGKDTDDSFSESDFYYEGYAYYIQVKVLEWAGYPVISSEADYQALLTLFMENNPVSYSGETFVAFRSPEDGYEEYRELIKTGALLGLYDKWENIAELTADYQSNVLREEGCDYVPLGIGLSAETVMQTKGADAAGEEAAKAYEDALRVYQDTLSETVLACLAEYGAKTCRELMVAVGAPQSD